MIHPESDSKDSVDRSDTEPLDLTPRDQPIRSGRSGRTKWPAVVIGLVIVGAIGFVLSRGLSDATVFYYNVDQIPAKRADIGTSRIRVQGNVVEGSVKRTTNGVNFTLRFRSAEISVRHSGEPPELFGPQIPVVIEGAFASSQAGATFDSDRILIKHDPEYNEKNADRLKDAERDADRPEPPAPAGPDQATP